MKTLLAITAAASLLGAIFLTFAWYRPSAPVSVAVGFLGYTNGPTGERFARFGFTNESGVVLRRMGLFTREVRNSPLLGYTRPLRPDVLLSAGQAEVIVVPLDTRPVSTYHKDWRAVFSWRRENWKTRFDIWAATSEWLPISFPRSYRVEWAPSEWLDQ